MFVQSRIHNFVEDLNLDWKEIIFKGSSCDDVKLRCFLNTEITIFLDYIHSMKGLKKLPTMTGLAHHIAITKKLMISNSFKYKSIINYMVEKLAGHFHEHI